MEAGAAADRGEGTWSPSTVKSWAGAPIGRDVPALDVAGGREGSVGVRAVVEAHREDPRILRVGEHEVGAVQSPAHSG